MVESKKIVPKIEPPTPPEKKHHGGAVVWALFVIFLGVVLLLNNLGVVPWTVWVGLWKFWPLLLVLWGVQLILGGSWGAALATAILTLLIFGGLVALVLSSFLPDFNDRMMHFAPWWDDFRMGVTQEEEQTKQITVEATAYPGAKKRDVAVDLSWGTLNLGDDATTRLLAVDSVYFNLTGEPQIESDLDTAGTLHLTFDTANDSWFPHFRMGEQRYDLTLGQTALLTQLAVELGAGEGTIDLTQLETEIITTKVGAGELTMELGASAIPTGGIKLEVGAGTTTLRIPATIGFKITYDVGVGNLIVDGQTLTSGLSNEGTFTSENYAGATTRVEIEVKVGVGSAVIRTQ